jgi:DNA-binding CsgD family transcriptional regulator
MNSRLFTEIATHHALARLIDNLNKPRFWKNLILFLNEVIPFDNALALQVVADGTPHVFAEYCPAGAGSPSPVPFYLNGLYLLDPFLQSAHEGLADGLYRLEEIAPDLFRQSEYFLTYFRDVVGEDEVQLVVNQTTIKGTVMLSFGARTRFHPDSIGRLAVCTPWVISLIKQHLTCMNTLSNDNCDNGDLPGRVRQTLAVFGAELLSDREMEIARLVLRGNSSKAIAERLGISPETVKVHRRNLYNKLGISTQPELFSLFIQALEHEIK